MLYGVLAFLTLIAIYAWAIEPQQTVITRYTVRVKKLTRPVRVLLLTDFHLGIFTSPHLLLCKINQVQPAEVDLILLGGDFLDMSGRYLPGVVSLAKRLQEFTVPIVAVLGNHDYDALGKRIKILDEHLVSSGIAVLHNQAQKLHVAGQELVVVGVEDLQQAPVYGLGKPLVSAAGYRKRCQQLDWYARHDTFYPELPRVVLSHNPDGIYLPGRKPDVVLAGHTHGGQLFLIDWLGQLFWWLFWKLLPDGSFRTWAGRQEIGRVPLIVSRGLASSWMPFRLGRPPEIVVVTLHP